MNRCDRIRELLPSFVEGRLEPRDVEAVEAHLETCGACRETVEALRLVGSAGSLVEAITPPAHLEEALTATPCARWLGMLHSAVDHELEPSSLARLLGHLETCEGCRRAWDDLTLIHQVGAAMTPPADLEHRCRNLGNLGRRESRILGFRTATAVAYLLAVLTTLLLGNPVTLARNESGIFHQAKTVVRETVTTVTDESRGEIRLMLWRTWQWGRQQATVLRELVTGSGNDTTPAESTTPDRTKEDADERT